VNDLTMGTRGAVGGLVTRRLADWRSTADAAVYGDLQLRVEQAEDGSGAFEGWGCIYGVRDSYGTTFNPGCFTEGGLDESAYAYLWMHSPMIPTGTFVAEERDEGLWIAGEWDPTPEGQTARMRALSGSAPENSVGFVWLADGGEDDPDLITSARLVETSQITLRMAAVPGANLLSVKAAEAIHDEEDRKAVALAALRSVDPLVQAQRERTRALLDLRLAEAGAV
jgi:HK97 family phage prohead protease